MFKDQDKRIFELEKRQVENCGERLRTVECNQKYMAGKIAILVMAVGTIVLFLCNLFLKWGK